jgi:hypothetical protein
MNAAPTTPTVAAPRTTGTRSLTAYYLGRPAHVWLAALSPTAHAGRHHNSAATYAACVARQRHGTTLS